MKLDVTISGGKATLVTTEGETETTIELEGELDQNALILNATTEKEDDDDSEDYSLFSTDTMRFYLLEDGKLCFTTGDSLDAEVVRLGPIRQRGLAKDRKEAQTGTTREQTRGRALIAPAVGV